MTAQRDPLMAAISRVEKKIDQVSTQVDDHEKKLRWIMYAAVLVVGAVGGPDAVQLITGGAV